MGKFLKTIVSSAAVGAAVGYFLTTKKGQEIKEKAVDFANGYKDNPETYNQAVKKKANQYKNLAVNTFNDYKEKFETGELTKEDVLDVAKEKATQASEFANDQVVAFRDKFVKAKSESSSDTQAEVDDIVIDYPESDETSQEN
ncbi:YtxH domain-containing protein [Streptococcus tangpeifui]|uniref:YtxH domain-containing protein n=1 Tax=Streptococcus tangpeifui TaxID=2709400 RepID=UPI0013EB0CB6|nr:YtxH domain-containing protein [Streptococcus sp. ZJ1593]